MSDILVAYYKKSTAFLLSFLMFIITPITRDIPKAKDPIQATQINYCFDDDQILIGGYSYNLAFTDDEHLGYVRDAGIDFLISGANDAFLDACYRNGIGVIAKSYGGLPIYGWTDIDTSGNSPWLTFKASDFKDHPALWGNDLMDEPSISSFSTLAGMVNSYHSKTNGKMALINLYPAYADEEQLGVTADWYAFSKEYKQINTYQKHINEYIQTIDTDYISADIYPLLEKKDATTGKSMKYTHPTWLKNLDILATACRNTNRDLWLITQVVGMEYNGSTVTRIAKEEDIRWQAYTSLSFGAKAIIHACYQNGWWDDNSHLVNKDGIRTESYYYAQTVNKEIKAISDVYMDYDNLGAFVHNAHKETHTRIALSKVKFDTISSIKSDETLLIGCFKAKSGNNTAFTMVNMTEIGDNKIAKAKFQLEDAKTVTAYVKGVPTDLQPDAKGNYSLTLASGEGVLVTVGH